MAMDGKLPEGGESPSPAPSPSALPGPYSDFILEERGAVDVKSKGTGAAS